MSALPVDADGDRSATGNGWDCHVHLFDASRPVAAGHYRPADRPLAQIESVAAASSVQHLVLVQPSVYGSDNSLLLEALKRQPGRHRGVVVLGDDVDGRRLAPMHDDGIRGARLNLISPVGEAEADVEARFLALAPRLREQGWHLQWYAAPEHLAKIQRWHAGSGVTAVLDHLAGLHAGLPGSHPAWRAVKALADDGAWIKLSGWYRLRASEPYKDLAETVQRLAGWFGDRMVWGSDWPHTAFAPDAMPSYASMWWPVLQALGPARANDVRSGGLRLYGP